MNRHHGKKLTSLALILLLAILMTGCDKDLYFIEPKGSESSQESTNEAGSQQNQVEPAIISESKEDNKAATRDLVKEPVVEAEEVSSEDQSKEEEGDGFDETIFINQFSESDTYSYEGDTDLLSTEENSWSFRRNTTHEPVESYMAFDISQFGGYYLGDTSEKVIYLTFDEGYEYGFSGDILDTLAANGVKASFFVTKYFIDSNPDLVLRMEEEGHIVGSHSATHPSLPTLSDEELYDEIVSTAEAYESLTGQEMDPFLRPPQGTYSERSMYLTRMLGYRTIFWSMAFKDWDTENQPGKEASYQHVMDNVHSGSIILLHAVSESNTLALDDIIKSLKEEGYRFGSLYELE